MDIPVKAQQAIDKLSGEGKLYVDMHWDHSEQCLVGIIGPFSLVGRGQYNNRLNRCQMVSVDFPGFEVRVYSSGMYKHVSHGTGLVRHGAESAGVRVINIADPHQKIPHPHVYYDGGIPCWGTWDNMIFQLCEKEEYVQVMLLTHTFLTSNDIGGHAGQAKSLDNFAAYTGHAFSKVQPKEGDFPEEDADFIHHFDDGWEDLHGNYTMEEE